MTREQDIPCHRCTHLCIDATDVKKLPRVEPAFVRRASDLLVRLFGEEYRIVRKDVRCRKLNLPANRYPIHRALSLVVQRCEFSDIDWTQTNAYYHGILPSEAAYWVNGKMISKERLEPALRKIIRFDATKRKKIIDTLRNAGVSIQ